MQMKTISDADIPKQSKIRKSLSFGYRIYHIICEVSRLPLHLCFAYGSVKISVESLVHTSGRGDNRGRRNKSAWNAEFLQTDSRWQIWN